ncbi:hypothetical protein [Zavarzinella formosa]|uniref:hypothetical protein n=1 Tax=Zavarzinella formosa TaxID=360055 RepID=UPI00031AA59B|nr:hypothetical protein [Zavarzinella formosa]
MPPSVSFRRLFVPLMLLAPLWGCSESRPEPELFPVSGRVTKGGKPVKGGGMIFIPEVSSGAGLSVNASVSQDGAFEGETLRTDKTGRTVGTPGVPAGKYKVVYHPPSNGAKLGLEVTLPEPVTVEGAPNVLNIELPEKLPEGKGTKREEETPEPEIKKD